MIVLGPGEPRRFALGSLSLHALGFATGFKLPSFISEPCLSVEDGLFPGLGLSAFPQLGAFEVLPDALPFLVHLSLALLDAMSIGFLCLAGQLRRFLSDSSFRGPVGLVQASVGERLDGLSLRPGR